MAAPVLQFKRGLLTNLPGLRAGEPGFTTDSYDLYVGLTSSTATNKFFGSHRYWTKETTARGSGVNLVEGTTNGTDYITLASPASVGAAVTYYFPASQGTSSSVLTNDGSGNLSWASGSANPVFTGIATFTDTTDNTLGNADTGAVQIDGGLGINKNVTIGQNLHVAGYANFVGVVTFQGGTINLGDSNTDNINVSGEFISNLTPDVNNTYDIGISTQKWRNGNFSGNLNSSSLSVSGITTLGQTNTTGFSNAGVSTLGNATSSTLVVSGFSTLSSVSAANLTLAGVTTGLNVPGISTLGFVQHTTLNVSGVSTFSGGVNASEGADLARLRVTGITTLGQTNTTGFSNAGLSTLGNVTATTVVVSGFSTLSSVSAANLTLAGITTGLNVPGISTLGFVQNTTLNVSGVSTFSGGISGSEGADLARLRVTGITTLGQISATGLNVGVTTVTSLSSSGNVTVGGNLFVNGSTTQVNTSTLTVEDRTIELGIVDGSAPSSTTTWDLGVLFNYYQSSAKKSAVIWEQNSSRFVFGSDVTDGGGTDNNSPQITFTSYASIEIGALWVNDCAGQSQVINCSAGVRTLENITIDCGAF